MTAMIFLGMAAMDIYIPSLPQMMHEFATTPSIINLTLSCYTGGVAIGVLFVGELSNRYGRRKLLLNANIAFMVSSVMIACIHYLPIIIMCRIIQSFCAATGIIVTRLAIKDCMDPQEQLKASGIILMGLIISPAIAPIIGAYIAKHFSWQISSYFGSGL